MTLTDTTGAHSGIVDYTKGIDRNGNRVTPNRSVTSPSIATATIKEGDLLLWDLDGTLSSTTGLAADTPLGVRPMVTTSTAEQFFAGVAGNDATAGEIVEVIEQGVVFVRVPSGTTPAVGDRVIKPAGATPGQCGVSSTWDATVVAGTSFGVVLAAKDSTTASGNQKVLCKIGRF